MTLKEEKELKVRIIEWFDLSAVGLTDEDLIKSNNLKRIIYEMEKLSLFKRLKSRLKSYQFNYLFNEMTKSNSYKYMYGSYERRVGIPKKRSKSFYEGFEMVIKPNYKPYLTNPEKLARIGFLLENTIENFNLLLKQDGILDIYSFKVVVYNSWYLEEYIAILLLNVNESNRVYYNMMRD